MSDQTGWTRLLGPAIVVALAVAGAILLGQATRASAPPFTDRPLRLGVNLALEAASDRAIAETLDAVAAHGLVWVRQRFPWDALEPQRGRFVWEQADRIIAAAQARGLRVIAVLDGSPAWARPQAPANPLAPPQDARDFGRFVAAFAARYGDRIDYYQIWDEPNIQPHWSGPVSAAGYVSLLREGALAARQADPGARVLAAALAPTLERGPWNLDEIEFLRGMYRAGAAPWFDIAAAQPFGFEAPPTAWARRDRLNFARVKLLRAEMERAGDGQKPIWSVRYGWYARASDDDGDSMWGAVTPTQQAAWAGEAAARAQREWPWLGALLWATWQPAAPPDDARWGFALVDADGAPRAALIELAAAARSASVARPGRYAMDHPALQWQGSWRQANGAADVGRSGDTLTIPFEGTQLDLQIQRGPFWGVFRVEVDGHPANALPRDSTGRAYLALYDPRGGAQWVTVARGLRPGRHTARLTAEGGWGQWALTGFAVGGASWPDERWMGAGFLAIAASLVVVRRRSLPQAMRGRAWAPALALWGAAKRWARSFEEAPTLWQAIALGGAVAFYAAVPFPWAVAPLGLTGWLIARAPAPGLALIAFAIPFYYIQKPLNNGGWLSYSEALIGAAFVWRIGRWRPEGGRNGLDRAVGLWVLAGVAAAWIAPDASGAWLALRRLVLAPAAFYRLWRLLPTGRATVERCRWWTAAGLLAAGLLVSIVGVADLARGGGELGRLRSVFYSPNEAALFLTRLWPLGMSLILSALTFSSSSLHEVMKGKGQKFIAPSLSQARSDLRPIGGEGVVALCPSWWLVFLPGVATAGMLLALALTFSRGAWLLGAPAGLLALGACWRGRRWWVWGGWAVAATAGAALLVRGVDATLRLSVWRAAWAMWLDHPWLGAGLDGFQWLYPRYMALSAWREPLLYHPHNWPLEIATWMGIVGLATAGLVGWAGIRAWRRAMAAPSPILAGMGAGLVAGLAHGMVDAGYFLPHLALLTMLTLGMAAAGDWRDADETI